MAGDVSLPLHLALLIEHAKRLTDKAIGSDKMETSIALVSALSLSSCPKPAQLYKALTTPVAAASNFDLLLSSAKQKLGPEGVCASH